MIPATGWCALIGSSNNSQRAVPLAVWVVLDDATIYGVVVGDDGRINLSEDNVEEYAGFAGYKLVAKGAE